MPLVTSTYSAPLWVKNRHINTIVRELFRRVPQSYEREVLECDDGDFLDLDWLPSQKSKSVVLGCHGLEGNSESTYLKGALVALCESGFDGLALNFRTCSGRPNRFPIAYTAGDSHDVRRVIEHLINKGYERIYLLGFSLGANVVMRTMTEDPVDEVKGAMAISTPIDLHAVAKRLAAFENALYSSGFLRSLKKKFRMKLASHPEDFEGIDLNAVKHVTQFDDAVTAKIHGYNDALHYYQTCSTHTALDRIDRPTLMLSAQDDPFLAPSCFPFEQAKAHKHLYLEAPTTGGHCAFVSWPIGRWLDSRIVEFIATLDEKVKGKP